MTDGFVNTKWLETEVGVKLLECETSNVKLAGIGMHFGQGHASVIASHEAVLVDEMQTHGA